MSQQPTTIPTARIGLALAGGGPQGACYEIGVLHALEEVLEGVDFTRDVHTYVGVSAGAVVASCLVNGISIQELSHSLLSDRPEAHPMTPGVMFRPAVAEFARRSALAPRLFYNAITDYLSNPIDQTLLQSFAPLVRLLPNGLFDNDPLREFLAKSFDHPGRTDDFRELERRLYVIAADLDSGEAVRFGDEDWNHVPISQAVKASTALPGMYPPVEINGRHYLDGVLLKTLHATVAVESGANLLICVNPLVPVDTIHTVSQGIMRRGKLIDRGLPTLISQTFRTLIHSRLSSVFDLYEDIYPGVGMVLIEPPRDDYQMFFSNAFSVRNRKVIFEHAYRSTRKQLWERREELTETFAARGITLHADQLADDRDPWSDIPEREEPQAKPLTRQLDSTLDRLERLIG